MEPWGILFATFWVIGLSFPRLLFFLFPQKVFGFPFLAHNHVAQLGVAAGVCELQMIFFSRFLGLFKGFFMAFR